MKVLIISHNCFSKVYNNGKTLAAVFSDFKPKELCQLYFTEHGALDDECCHDYYLFSDRDALKSIVDRREKGHVVECKTNLDEHNNTQPEKIVVIKKNYLTTYLRNIVWRLSGWFNDELKNWLKNQKPDVIFYVGGESIFSHRIALRLQQWMNIPLVVYFTDDYVISPEKNWYVKKLEKVYRKTISASAACYAIGDKMCDAYTNYFQKSFHPIMNVVNKLPYDNHQFSNELVVSYFGGLHLGRDEAIVELASQIGSKKREFKYTFNVYTFSQLSQEQKDVLISNGVSLHSGVSGKNLEDAMRNTDIFIHIESNQKKFSDLTKFSVSTKIPEYMMLSRPILAYGPKNLASLELIASVQKSLVIDSSDFNKADWNVIIDQLSKLELLSAISKSNHEYAVKSFTKDVVSKKFKQEIISCVR